MLGEVTVHTILSVTDLYIYIYIYDVIHDRALCHINAGIA